jgi:hypothetical protein
VRNVEQLQHLQSFKKRSLDVGGAAGFPQECRLIVELEGYAQS